MTTQVSPPGSKHVYLTQVLFGLLAAMLALMMPAAASAQGNLTLRDPYRFAGRWESPDGQGGSVGMDITITTHINGTAPGLGGRPQSVDEFNADIFHRTYPKSRSPLALNFFSNAPGGGMTWDGQRLVIHFVDAENDRGAFNDAQRINVDLVWHEDTQDWTGYFGRGKFGKRVTLKRPARSGGKNPFVGTWSDEGGIMNNCVHISEEADGSLIAWADDLQLPGRIRYAEGVQQPAQTMEHYGEIAKVTVNSISAISIDLRAYTAMCCSHPFAAKISEDGHRLRGAWLAGPNQAFRPVIWTKMKGGYCIPAL